jgi:phytoene dehydrogenase-like protein
MAMADTHEFVIVGSGMNSLVCAAMLARAGKQVVVLERNDRIGGCIRTEELFPGYTHDILSSSYPLFVAGPAYEALGPDLHAAGLEFANTDLPTAVLTGDRRSLIMSTDGPETGRRFDAVHQGDGAKFGSIIGNFFEANADLTFGLLGNELYSRSRDFQSDLVQGLIAPWVLHAGLGPDDAYSGLMGKVIMGAVGMAGMPVVVGGSHRIIEAFQTVIEGNGGSFVADADVARITVTDGKAGGVVTADGTSYAATEAVICNVTPTQLYGRLLDNPPPDVAAKAGAYRYGRADMQVHYALSAPPDWPDPELTRVAYVHITSGLDGVSKAVNEAERGLLPESGTIVVGQPVALDPSRAPDGGWIFWIQLQELPTRIKGDAAGEISVPADGEWNPEVKEAYLDRIERRLAALIPNFESSIVGRRAYSPAELEGLNMNLVGGDPYSGACTIDQFLLWRPFPGARNHETPVKRLYHIGASTHPGPGLGGNSGFMVASKFT